MNLFTPLQIAALVILAVVSAVGLYLFIKSDKLK